MSDSFAGFSAGENGNDGSEKADPCEDAPEAPPGEVGAPSLLTGCFRCSCRAFASAFSCVRTNCASRLMNSWPSSESIGSYQHAGSAGVDSLWRLVVVVDRSRQGCRGRRGRGGCPGQVVVTLTDVRRRERTGEYAAALSLEFKALNNNRLAWNHTSLLHTLHRTRTATDKRAKTKRKRVYRQ